MTPTDAEIAMELIEQLEDRITRYGKHKRDGQCLFEEDWKFLEELITAALAEKSEFAKAMHTLAEARFEKIAELEAESEALNHSFQQLTLERDTEILRARNAEKRIKELENLTHFGNSPAAENEQLKKRIEELEKEVEGFEKVIICAGEKNAELEAEIGRLKHALSHSTPLIPEEAEGYPCPYKELETKLTSAMRVVEVARSLYEFAGCSAVDVDCPKCDMKDALKQFDEVSK